MIKEENQEFEQEKEEVSEEVLEEKEVEVVKEKKREIAIPGEIIVTGKDYLPGDGCRREGDNIIASKYGLADVSGRLVKVISLSGAYIPRVGNVVIGVVVDVTFNGWLMDIRAPYSSFLSVSEVSRYIKGDLTEYFNIGDTVAVKIDSVKPRGIDLTARLRGLGKLEQGMIIFINSNKVPRVIGREGSMINLIKENTGCDIVVGQNGIVWIKGENVEAELKAKEAIMFVVSKSYVEGLTDKVQKYFEERKK